MIITASDTIKVYIYKIQNIINGKCYIGSTLNFKSRKSSHLNDLLNNRHHNKYLQRSFNKYGIDAFSIDLIDKCDEPMRKEKETEWIIALSSWAEQCGFNMDTPLVNEKRQRVVTAGTREKMSKAQKGNKRALGYKHSENAKKRIGDASKGNKYRLGRKTSDETKEILTRSLIGNKRRLGTSHSEETRNKMRMSQLNRWKLKKGDIL